MTQVEAEANSLSGANRAAHREAVAVTRFAHVYFAPNFSFSFLRRSMARSRSSFAF
jgi:hypothetical protein